MNPTTQPEIEADATGLTDSESLYEVVDGVRVELPPMGAFATWVAAQLNYHLSHHARAHRLGTVVPEMLFILDPVRDLRRRPDVAFVSRERWPIDRPPPEEGDWAIVPDLAIEVLSPHDLSKNVLHKIREYFRYGVGQVWQVHPTERQIYVYESPRRVTILGPEDELEGGLILPGFRLPVSILFPPAPAT
jgi:Uma2 family endonuclease